jgi:tetratricopeptide (TPR) repeat protein
MKLLAALLFLLAASLTQATDPDSVTSILAADGKTPDPAKVQKYIDWVERAMVEYPTHFKSEEEKKAMVDAAEKVTGEILTMDVHKMTDAKTVTTLAYILAMAHNVDLRTFAKSREFYQRALELDPDNVRANYLYGMLLISTERYHFDSLPYLQKALALGERDAQFSIAMLYYQKGDRASAIREMEGYAKARSKEPQIWDVIELMKKGTLEFSKQRPPGPPKGQTDSAGK